MESESDKAPFLREGDAAALLCLAVGTLQNLRIRGDGPAFIRLGGQERGRVVYSRADLIAWAEARRRISTSDPGPALQGAA